jgi:lysyl-tRNA synthetase class 2
MIESYMAYGDWMSIADLTRTLVQNAAMAVAGSHVVTHHDGRQADLGGQWKQISLYDAISNGVGESVTALTPIADLKKIAEGLDLEDGRAEVDEVAWASQENKEEVEN